MKKVLTVLMVAVICLSAFAVNFDDALVDFGGNISSRVVLDIETSKTPSFDETLYLEVVDANKEENFFKIEENYSLNSKLLSFKSFFNYSFDLDDNDLISVSSYNASLQTDTSAIANKSLIDNVELNIPLYLSYDHSLQENEVIGFGLGYSYDYYSVQDLGYVNNNLFSLNVGYENTVSDLKAYSAYLNASYKIEKKKEETEYNDLLTFILPVEYYTEANNSYWLIDVQPQFSMSREDVIKGNEVKFDKGNLSISASTDVVSKDLPIYASGRIAFGSEIRNMLSEPKFRNTLSVTANVVLPQFLASKLSNTHATSFSASFGCVLPETISTLEKTEPTFAFRMKSSLFDKVFESSNETIDTVETAVLLEYDLDYQNLKKLNNRLNNRFVLVSNLKANSAKKDVSYILRAALNLNFTSKKEENTFTTPARDCSLTISFGFESDVINDDIIMNSYFDEKLDNLTKPMFNSELVSDMF